MEPGLGKAWPGSGVGLVPSGWASRAEGVSPGFGAVSPGFGAVSRCSRRVSPSVPQIRTQDLSYFREIPRAQGYLARIRPVQPTHGGTFSCVITHDQRPLARLYFFLNVTGPPPRGETELQVSFREVLRWAPREAEMIEPWRPSLGELLASPEALTPGNQCLLAAAVALASAGVTVLAW